MTEQEARNKIVSTAISWLGRAESNGSFREIIDFYNTIIPLPRGYRMSYQDPWCAAFVSAVGKKAGMQGIIFSECACDPMIELYKARGQWVENDEYIPKPGDIIMYDWDDNGIGDNASSADHVGIVESISGNKITIIEGNISDSVGRRTININGRYIRGYCVPNYDYEEVKDEQKASNTNDFPLVQEGSSSVYVAMLQGALEYYGYKPAWYVGKWSDGDFGSSTKLATINFQNDHGLEPDGRCGPKTWNTVFSGG